jgi:hypothetical protein
VVLCGKEREVRLRGPEKDQPLDIRVEAQKNLLADTVR